MHTHTHTHTHIYIYIYIIYKGISLHNVTTYSHFHLSSGILIRKYNNVMNTLQKKQEHPPKISVCFQTGDKGNNKITELRTILIRSLSTCLLVGIDMVPPSTLLWCLRPKQLRHNIHDVNF